MKVSIEQDRCIAAGQCVAAAPEVFDQRDEDGVVVLLTPVAPDGTEDDVQHAASACPAQVIHVQV
ncbi:ferredoxin [Saccharopolyspora sp. HNM0983]|uniref:Ferredoxin n=1 Tax=Saccharopolyspora montiporae TaxID=2781240 RepID=A0A929B8A0_9PSEU|nr:ferredoxin [Saccharopolyspora sp. HNM0983]MBE9373271.1 ferredoxin [Saccharopolyspora sp. HNM0983]